jgi:hypothetical protein
MSRDGMAGFLRPSPGGSASGLFVPKPSTGPSCQSRRTPDLGRGAHRCPPASVVGRGGSYSLGYSALGHARSCPGRSTIRSVECAAGSDDSVHAGWPGRMVLTVSRCSPVLHDAVRPESGPIRRHAVSACPYKGRADKWPLPYEKTICAADAGQAHASAPSYQQQGQGSCLGGSRGCAVRRSLLYGLALWKLPDLMPLKETQSRYDARLLVISIGGSGSSCLGSPLHCSQLPAISTRANN